MSKINLPHLLFTQFYWTLRALETGDEDISTPSNQSDGCKPISNQRGQHKNMGLFGNHLLHGRVKRLPVLNRILSGSLVIW